MPLTKENADSVLPAVGSRVLRTVGHADGTFGLDYTAVDNAGIPHPGTTTSVVAAAWIANAIANPGANAAIDALMVANPNFTAAYLAVARQMLFIYCDYQLLGFAETP